MTRPAVRFALLIVFLAAMGATAYLFWMAERQSQLTESASRAFDDSARAADTLVFDLRTAQQAYVATGQGEEFWMSRTTALASDLKSRIAWLKSDAGPASASAFDEALSGLQDFEQMDRRAREYTRSRQPLLASDEIFTKGLDLSRKMSDGIERGRAAEIAARDAVRGALQRREAFSLGAAAAAATLIVLLLMPANRPAPAPEPATRRMAPPPPRAYPAVNTSLDLDSLDTFDADEGWTHARTPPADPPIAAAPVEASAPAPAAEPAPIEAPTVEPVPVQAPPVPPLPVEAPSLDIRAVATVCTDLARVVDTRDLPDLLERTAGVLDASGIILWIADPDGRELAPIVTHGYPANLISRLGTIGRDAKNVTAAAYRTSLLQTVRADSASNGAIAAPLLTPAGCVGVMAAEVRHEAEGHETVLAAASIVAAQLATLVGPPSARSKSAEAIG